MRRKLFTAFSVMMLLALVVTTPAPRNTMAQSTTTHRHAATAKFDAHYRVPNEGVIPLLLEEEGVSLDGLTADQKLAKVQEYEKKFHEMNPDTPDPAKLRKLLEKESQGATMQVQAQKASAGKLGASETDRSIKSLITLMEFNPASETWTSQVDPAGNCVDTQVTMAGPLHNAIPAPGPRDNNTIWYQDTNPTLYNEIYFGEGPKAGVIVQHPNVGKVDLRGKTMVNYYLEMSGGKFAPAGEVYPQWFPAKHAEGWYGEDGCGGSHNVRAGDLVIEAIDNVKAADPNFNWQGFDGDADGIVDNFTVIHAGMGQEAGGGEQGTFSIWSHASMIGWPNGYLVCEMGSAGCPDRSISVLHYSMDPENIDLGVIAEEFGHAAFGLPDLYSTDTQGSVSNWAIMESGSWNGQLGGTEPAPFPLWFKYLLGWATPDETDYDSPAKVTMIGQLENTPEYTDPGLKVNLPPVEIPVGNPLDTGKAWWSDVGNGLSQSLSHDVDLSSATAPVLSFLSFWSMEEDWDYGYVEVSTDGGATWSMLPDMDGIFRTTDPNGNNLGVGLTGEGQGTLRFDLAAFAGKQVTVRLVYSTDTAVAWDGWFVDNIAVTDGGSTLWSDDVEAGADAWAANGWQLIPLTKTFSRYYLAEWRNNQGFDRGLKYAYTTIYSDADEWKVDRAPYTVPGMLLYMRDASYAFDYTLNDATFDPPSIGPKHALLLVDSHFWPYEWNDYKYASGAYLRVNSRVQPGNATFTLQSTTPFTIRLGADPATGAYQPEPIQTKTFGPLPGVSAFHDSLGYYPGLLHAANGGLYFWDRPASMVIPAKGIYSTRITEVNRTPYLPYYGATVNGLPLGTGNPGDAGVQYGFHIAVVGKAKNGIFAKLLTWNSPVLHDLSMRKTRSTARPGTTLTFVLKVTNVTPVTQKFVLTDAIPANTTVVNGGNNYDVEKNAMVWKGTLQSNDSVTYTFTVRIDAGTLAGTVITNTANLVDEALGNSATVDTTVTKK